LSADPRLKAIEENLSKIKHVVLIASGKGGVGKTTVSLILSLLLSKRKFKVGLLDLDLNCPTLKVLIERLEEPVETKYGLEPYTIYGVKMFSPSMFTRNDQPIPMRGGLKGEAVKTIFANISWGELDYLVVDLPPGTCDELLTTCYVTSKHRRTAVLVTIPSKLSLTAVLRTANVLRRLKVPMSGVIVNMAGIHCGGEFIRVLGHVDPRKTLNMYDLPVISELPLDPRLAIAIDDGNVDLILNSKVAEIIDGDVVEKIIEWSRKCA